MEEAIAENYDRILWDEVRKITKYKDELPRMMDRQTGTEEISKIFADKYEALYNTAATIIIWTSLKKKLIQILQKNFPNDLVQSNNRYSITVKELKDAVVILKLGNKEGNRLFKLFQVWF